mgnify:CR=1 FL=1
MSSIPDIRSLDEATVLGSVSTERAAPLMAGLLCLLGVYVLVRFTLGLDGHVVVVTCFVLIARDRDMLADRAGQVTALHVRLDAMVNVYSYPGRPLIIIVYAASVLSGELCTDEECLEARIFAPDEIPWSRLAFRSTHEALRDYLAGHRHSLPGHSGMSDLPV